jgi:NTE family protein
MVAHSRGESFEGLTGPDGRPASEADRGAGAVFRLHRGLPMLGPGSLRMAFTALSQPLRHTPMQMLAGWIPSGLISTDALEDVVRRAIPGRWVDHPNFWTVACDYGSGRRTVFGRLDAPRVEMSKAVAASCAVPGFYRPVGIGSRRYVDGGVCSPSNLDVVAGRGLDLVICLSPLSTGGALGAVASPQASGMLGAIDPRRLPEALGRRAGRRLAHELRKVEGFGTEVVLIEPTDDDHAVMGHNLMNPARRDEVIETAERTVAEQLRRPEVRRLLERLPAGEPHKIARPEGHPSTWPSLEPAVARSVLPDEEADRAGAAAGRSKAA